jgi:hypothetical protein
MDADDNKPSYRRYALTHGLNLSFLAGAGLAGALINPIIWVVAAPLALGALWVVPDLASFRRRVDRMQRMQEIQRERAYCLEHLWGLKPREKSLMDTLLGAFLEIDDDDPSPRVIKRDVTFERYMEMRELLSKLRELENVRGNNIVSQDIQRFEQVINGYLRYQIACRSLADALKTMNESEAQKEVSALEEQLKTAPPDLRMVLSERKRLRESQLERIPKLQATLELLRTRADTVVYQMRNFYGQVLADPGADVSSFLEDMLEKHEMMADPLGELEADQTVREILRSSRTESPRPVKAPLNPSSRSSLRQG